MQQHYALSAFARSLRLDQIIGMTDAEARDTFPPRSVERLQRRAVLPVLGLPDSLDAAEIRPRWKYRVVAASSRSRSELGPANAAPFERCSEHANESQRRCSVTILSSNRCGELTSRSPQRRKSSVQQTEHPSKGRLSNEWLPLRKP